MFLYMLVSTSSQFSSYTSAATMHGVWSKRRKEEDAMSGTMLYLCNTAPNLFHKYNLAAFGKMRMYECGCQCAKCRKILRKLSVDITCRLGLVLDLESGLELGSG